MTTIFPGSLVYAGKRLHNVVMCCVICFIWTFLGLTEKPHSYYVGNIKGCAATGAEVESVGGLWHTPGLSPSAHQKTCMYCVSVRVSAACVPVSVAKRGEGSHPASNEAVWQCGPTSKETASYPQPCTFWRKSSLTPCEWGLLIGKISVFLYQKHWKCWAFQILNFVQSNSAKTNQAWGNWLFLCYRTIPAWVSVNKRIILTSPGFLCTSVFFGGEGMCASARFIGVHISLTSGCKGLLPHRYFTSSGYTSPIHPQRERERETESNQRGERAVKSPARSHAN